MSLGSTTLISSKIPPSRVNYETIGGKAWNLFQLQHIGFAVPPWFVISTAVLDLLLQPVRESIQRRLSTADPLHYESLEQTSSGVKAMIFDLQIPEEWRDEIAQKMDQEFGEEELFSVRSSVVGEDSNKNSFAGQMASFLNIRREGILDGVKGVWASAFSARVLAYRCRKNISVTDISVAVIIQRMVQSVASGVLFSRDPHTGARECVISAGFGLGEGVVSDLVETDTYWISWEADNIMKKVEVKEKRVTCANLQEGRTTLESVPSAEQSVQVLEDVQILELRDLAHVVEECFGSPQDIEWAIDKDGQLHILQTRPIVFPTTEAAASQFRVWDNSNIVESYPGLTLPLTFSFIRTAYENTFRNAASGFLLFKKEMVKKLTIFKSMIGLLDGRVYYNLLNWYEMLSYLPGFEKHKRSWDQMIGITRKLDFQEKKLSGVTRLGTLLVAIWRLLCVRRNAREFFSVFNSIYTKYKALDLSTYSEDQLIAIYEALDQEITPRWHLTLYNDFCAMKYYDWLKNLCSRWGLQRHTNLHNQLLCGEKGVESVAPLRSVVRLAEFVRSREEYRQLMEESDDHLIWEKIQKESDHVHVKNAIERHLQAFGDRGLEELKFDKPTFRDEPALLIGLVKNYCTLGLTVEEMEKQEQDIRNKAESFVRSTLRNPLKRLIVQFVLMNARHAIVNRENMRFARSRLYGIVRRLFRRFADLFVEKGILATPSDLHYLTVEEVFGFARGTAITRNLQALVDVRKAEYKEFGSRSPKDRIETEGIPYLNSFAQLPCLQETAQKLRGIGCSSGLAEGIAKVVLDPKSVNGSRGHILVARSTDPGWVFLMVASKGIVVEKGSVLSHTAIIGRELGIPTIIGVKDATRHIPDGAHVVLNGSTGEVQWE